jgi:hypothetical protein
MSWEINAFNHNNISFVHVTSSLLCVPRRIRVNSIIPMCSIWMYDVWISTHLCISMDTVQWGCRYGATVTVGKHSIHSFRILCLPVTYRIRTKKLKRIRRQHFLLFLAYFLFWKNRVGLSDHVVVLVCVYLCIPPIVAKQRLGKAPLSLLGNGYLFYAVRVVSKESRRFVLPKTSCFWVWKSLVTPSEERININLWFLWGSNIWI